MDKNNTLKAIQYTAAIFVISAIVLCIIVMFGFENVVGIDPEISTSIKTDVLFPLFYFLPKIVIGILISLGLSNLSGSIWEKIKGKP